jgi:hypothetical protein
MQVCMGGPRSDLNACAQRHTDPNAMGGVVSPTSRVRSHGLGGTVAPPWANHRSRATIFRSDRAQSRARPCLRCESTALPPQP